MGPVERMVRRHVFGALLRRLKEVLVDDRSVVTRTDRSNSIDFQPGPTHHNHPLAVNFRSDHFPGCRRCRLYSHWRNSLLYVKLTPQV